MCILCVIQKWSRRIATMLPWLVIPLIAMCLLSQFLPPAFRFEITSPRLACVFVLLITLFWYEILMPQLSAWRVRRNVRLMEKKRFEAIEMQKLRKTAIRRCRNCLTPYRDQNPGGGKFMCSYCGHISKRPVLDLPIPPGLTGLSNSVILKDLVGKSGKMLNGKFWSDDGWVCGQDWLENNGGFSSGGDDDCFSEKSYSRLVVSIGNILAKIFFSIMWTLRKIFNSSSSDDDASVDADIRGLENRGENGVNESRSEKARRKAEEKRQARLEKEQLEEEDRIQREEVARLVEERRKLRDEITEAEKERGRVSSREKYKKRETEKKRQERKKEKDKGSSKSNSDVHELEKRALKEIEKGRHHKLRAENLKQNSIDTTHGSKIVFTHNNNVGSFGTRYLDRMRGSFLSSRAFTGGGFFGKGIMANNTSSTREHQSSVALDHLQNIANKRDLSQSGHTSAKSNVFTDDKNINHPVQNESQPAPKKSWQQLFTRTPALPSSSGTNAVSRPITNSQKEGQSSVSSGYPTTKGFDNPTTFGSPYTLPNVTNTDLHLPSNSIFSRVGEVYDKILSEESDVFEDPCYDPDPLSLIGPVSESLDNFQLNLGFVPDFGHHVKRMSDLSEVSRPSPIESPMSRHVPMEDQSNKESEKGWQVWDSHGLAGPSNWLLTPELNDLNKDGRIQSPPKKTMASLFKKDDQKASSHFAYATTGDDQWMPMGSYRSMSRSDKHLALNSQDHNTRHELVFGNPNGYAINYPFQLSQGNFWAKKERAVSFSVEGQGSESSTIRPVGGGYIPPQMYSHFGRMNEEKQKLKTKK